MGKHTKGEMDVKIGEGLEIGSTHPAHKKGMVHGLGNKQAGTPSNSGESNHEALRSGSKPSPEKVCNMAHEDKGVQKKAAGFTKRSEEGGAEKEGGW